MLGYELSTVVFLGGPSLQFASADARRGVGTGWARRLPFAFPYRVFIWRSAIFAFIAGDTSRYLEGGLALVANLVTSNRLRWVGEEGASNKAEQPSQRVEGPRAGPT